MADGGRDSIRAGQVNALATPWHAGFASGKAAVPRETLFLWYPVALVFGIWIYFGMRIEPIWSLTVASGLVAIACMIFRRRHMLIALTGFLLLGFTVAKARIEYVQTPLLRAYVETATVQGHVVEVQQRGTRRLQLILDVTNVSAIPAGEVPVRMQITATGQQERPQIGDMVEIKGSLIPLPRPDYPGGFDVARYFYMKSIGATGRTRSVRIVDQASVPFSYRFPRWVDQMRATIGARIRANMEGAIGSFAEALVTGERASIPRSLNESLQTSGLFHILSISGLHMTLVAGGVYWLTRAALALSPRLALQWPIKKMAACVAIFVGLLYMILAGFGAATERSYIMIAIMFFAVLVDRPALSLHNLALAALMLLMLRPEEAVSAGFQMSFMAVAGIAAFYGWWSRRSETTQMRQRGRLVQYLRKLGSAFTASLVTTLIAGTMSGIVALHHFGRVSPYGILSNALALPVVGTLVMPSALIGTLLIPFELETLPFAVLEQGLNLIVWISDFISALPGAQGNLPQIAALPASFLSIAALVLCLTRSRLVFISIPLVVVATGFSLVEDHPSLMIDARARNVVLLTETGELVPALEKSGQDTYRRWARWRGDKASLREAAKRHGWTCSVTTCTAIIRGFSVLYLLESETGLGRCQPADIVIAQFPLRRQCAGKRLTIDRFDVWRNGAYAITLNGTHIAVETSRERQGSRPWAFDPRPRKQ